MDLEVVMVVTDRRVLFVSGADGSGSGTDAGSLEYADIAGVDVAPAERSDVDRLLEFAATHGVRWQFPLPADNGAVAAAVRHLTWIGEVRSRLVGTRNDVDLAAGEMGDFADAMDWQRAEETYQDAREALDRTIDAVNRTEPVSDHHLAPEVTDLERTLENAYAALYIERSTSKLTLGQQLVENEDYGQARKVLQRAQSLSEVASEHAAAVQRGDEFMFGEQRELDHDLDRLAWDIEAISAEPIRQAHEAKILAKSADDPSAAVEHWEQALRRYGNVLTLEWSDDERHFAGDREEVQGEIAAAAEELVVRHRDLARARWNEGVQRHEEGAVTAALRLYTEAQEHLSRSFELAEEFDPDTADAIGTQLRNIVDSLSRVRETATVDLAESRGERATGESDPAAHDDASFDRGPAEESAEVARNVQDPDEGKPFQTGRRRHASPPTERYSAADLTAIDTTADISLGEGGEPLDEAPPTEADNGGNEDANGTEEGVPPEDIVVNGDAE